MYKIKTKINGVSIEGLLAGDDLTDEQIQDSGADIFRPSLAMLKAKGKLDDKYKDKDDGKEPTKMVIEYELIEPPKTETPIAIVELDGLDHKQLLVQQVLAEQRLAAVQSAMLKHEQKEKEDIIVGLKDEVKSK